VGLWGWEAAKRDRARSAIERSRARKRKRPTDGSQTARLVDGPLAAKKPVRTSHPAASRRLKSQAALAPPCGEQRNRNRVSLAARSSQLAAIAHLAGLWFSDVATTFLVRPPQTPKDLGFRVFSPFRFCSCRPFGLKTPASCRTRNRE